MIKHCVDCGIELGRHTKYRCISCFNKSRIPWNKGKKGLQIGWNKGLPKEKQPFFGKKHTDEYKKSVSIPRHDYNEAFRKRLSQTRIDKGLSKGDKNPGWKGGPKIINCSFCGKKKRIKKSVFIKSKYHFCNFQCKGNWRKIHWTGVNNHRYGTHLSEEARLRIGEANRKKIISETTRTKMSESRKGLMVGEKNPMYGKCGVLSPAWQGGKSFEPYTLDFNKRFKEAIRERDHYCCQICNVGTDDLHLLKRKLSVHHIDYDKKNSFPQNCISLCNKCHALTHVNRESWELFFHKLLSERYNYKYTENQKIILDFCEYDTQ